MSPSDADEEDARLRALRSAVAAEVEPGSSAERSRSTTLLEAVVVIVVCSPVMLIAFALSLWLLTFIGAAVGDLDPVGPACVNYVDGGSTTEQGIESVDWGLFSGRACAGASGATTHPVVAGGASGFVLAVAVGWGAWAWVVWRMVRRGWSDG